MQTFLPLPDFVASAKVLDYRRLGKQRVEAFQILRALHDPKHGWRHHPAVKMWRGYESALGDYMNACISEWVSRGYRNTMSFYPFERSATYLLPGWFGDGTFHASHRSNLLRKDPTWYGQFGWNEPVDLPYVWPS